MKDSQKMETEKSVLQWGGLAGITGGVFFILVFVVVIVFVGADAAKPEREVVRFPEIRAARTVENTLYMVVLILWVAHFLALYRALRGTSLAPALFGSVLGVAGLVVLAAGALPHIVTARLSDLYHAPGATAEQQATLVLLWRANQSIFDALLFVGLFVLPIGLILLGVAMIGTPAFGKGFGRLSMVLGAGGLVAAAFLLIDPGSPSAVVGILALIAFHLILGWKVYSLSIARAGA